MSPPTSSASVVPGVSAAMLAGDWSPHSPARRAILKTRLQTWDPVKDMKNKRMHSVRHFANCEKQYSRKKLLCFETESYCVSLVGLELKT